MTYHKRIKAPTGDFENGRGIKHRIFRHGISPGLGCYDRPSRRTSRVSFVWDRFLRVAGSVLENPVSTSYIVFLFLLRYAGNKMPYSASALNQLDFLTPVVKHAFFSH
jgi:hypothetical protein